MWRGESCSDGGTRWSCSCCGPAGHSSDDGSLARTPGRRCLAHARHAASGAARVRLLAIQPPKIVHSRTLCTPTSTQEPRNRLCSAGDGDRQLEGAAVCEAGCAVRSGAACAWRGARAASAAARRARRSSLAAAGRDAGAAAAATGAGRRLAPPCPPPPPLAFSARLRHALAARCAVLRCVHVLCARTHTRAPALAARTPSLGVLRRQTPQHLCPPGRLLLCLAPAAHPPLLCPHLPLRLASAASVQPAAPPRPRH